MTTHATRTSRARCFWLATALGSALAVTQARPAAAQTPSAAATPQLVADPGRPGVAFASLGLPKGPLYVGESVPVTLRAYFSAGTGVTLTGAPTVNSPDFTLSLGDAAQGHTTISGEPYLAVTWKGRLSPVKAGHYELELEIPSTLEWRAAPVRSAAAPDSDPFGDVFGDLDGLGMNGDPFAAMQQHMQRLMNQAMQDFDTGPLQKRSLTLQSKPVALEIEPLPAAGRPANFSGAVGHFTLETSVREPNVRVGEPLDLSVVVRGDGNFDRVSSAGVPSSTTLESYPPTSKQTADEKTFVQPIVPRQAGRMEIPPVELSYFDPKSRRYETARSSPITLEVGQGQALAATRSGAVPNAATQPGLAPNAAGEGRVVASLSPLYTRRPFWLAQLAPLGALAAALSLVSRRKRLAADPHRHLRASARKALRRQTAAFEAAFAAGDAPGFFAAARGALQQRLGARWGIVPEAITLVEIERRTSGADLATLRTVFEADAARFGPGATQQDLGACHDAVRRILAHSEAS
ncbi:MAG TPA: BatD family protein [Polyangiaceae bacterium]|nr:BatD family protein [Polyangiaceae bacterium]